MVWYAYQRTRGNTQTMAQFWFITPTSTNSTTNATTAIIRRSVERLFSSSSPPLLSSTSKRVSASARSCFNFSYKGSATTVTRTTKEAPLDLPNLAFVKRVDRGRGNSSRKSSRSVATYTKSIASTSTVNSNTTALLFLLGTSFFSLLVRQRVIHIATTISTMSFSTSDRATASGSEGGSSGIVNNSSPATTFTTTSTSSPSCLTAEAFTVTPTYPTRNNSSKTTSTIGSGGSGGSGNGKGIDGSSSSSTSSSSTVSFGIRRITSKDGSKTMKALASSQEDGDNEEERSFAFGVGRKGGEERGTLYSRSNLKQSKQDLGSSGARKINQRGTKTATTTSTSLHASSDSATEITAQKSDRTKITESESLSTLLSTSNSKSTKTERTWPLPEGVDDSHPLYQIYKHFHPSWIEQLSPEETAEVVVADGDGKESMSPSISGSPMNNRSMRQVKNGHYVLVQPTPLKNPRLIAYSKELAIDELGLKEEDVLSDSFKRFFSGDLDVKGDTDGSNNSSTLENSSTSGSLTPSWSTPYALSIMGKRYYNNCPFGNGNGYGDGRAISIAEAEIPSKDNNGSSTTRYEFQLKGAGPTPFCCGADGRAVLRSSIREFLASEAMFHLGISTTRALSLIVSDGPNGNTSNRPWYSEQIDGRNASMQLPSLDDPRLAIYPLEKRKLFIQQLARQKRDPDIMIEEPNAITCRVAPSFARIGHVDLFARRVANVISRQTYKTNESYHSSKEYRELVQIIWHVAYREFYDEAYVPYRETEDLEKCIDVILKLSSERIATMIAGWLRVGFAQGNFNADNCLIGGRTMDYGPFGFMDDYQPLFAKWTGSGDHFGFLNQPTAGYVNFMVLIESMYQALKDINDKDGRTKEIEQKESDAMAYGRKQFESKVREMWRIKLGFHPNDETASDVWTALEPLLRKQSTDWTLFWRQLTKVAKEFQIRPNIEISTDYEAMLNTLIGDNVDNDQESPFYDSLDLEGYKNFQKWIQQWREALVKSVLDGKYEYSGTSSNAPWPEERMVKANPKYILREWMLVDAYSRAAKGDDSMVLELQQLTLDPYGEGTSEQHNKYYRRAPSASLTTGGTAFMT